VIDLGDADPTNSYIYETSALFIFANFQYLTTSLLFSLGRLWKQPIHTNHGFCAWWLVVFITSVLLVFAPEDHVFTFMQITWFPVSWRFETFFWGIFYAFLSVGSELGLSIAKRTGYFSSNKGDNRKPHKINREIFESGWSEPSNNQPNFFGGFFV